jgi:putative drug exporter of the RND superfamily
MIERIALSCFRNRWRTLFAWILFLAALIGGGGQFAGDFADGGRLVGSDSDAAYALSGAAFPDDGEGFSINVAFAQDRAGGLQTTATQSAIASFVTEANKLPNVSGVSGPEQVAPDGTVGLGTLTLTGDEAEQAAAAKALTALAARSTGVEVSFADSWFETGGLNALGEIIGVGVAIVVLLLAFGSIIAMGVPIVSALMGVAASAAGVGLWAAVVPTPEFTSEVALMIGLGVGIDYAVFIITRFRLARAKGKSPEAAIEEAMGTAGRAVVFAGSIVMVSLLGMLLMGLSYFQGLALGSASAVLISIVAAITLVPAMLSIAGRKIGKRAVLAAVSTKETFWHRWSRFVQRHAVACALGGTAILFALAAPVLSMRLATTDLGTTAKGTTTRTAHDRLSEAFGPGIHGPLLVVAPPATAQDPEKLKALVAKLESTNGVAQVLPTQMSPDGTVAQMVVFPTSGRQDAATSELVHRLRTDFRSSGTTIAHVGGGTASDIDFADLMGSRLPVFIGSVLAASFILLMLVFRSILVPLKAVVLNMLSIGAAYGLMVMVFQWGWLGSVFGVESGAPIEPWAPMMLFAIVFGLSMDYEVFLLSSVHERFVKTGDNSSAVVEGLATTARVITAAAAIMVAVFGAFVFNDDRGIKLIGFGLSAAVLIDATIVRMLLVPATMELLGPRNWWMPRILDRYLPKLSIERASQGAPPVGESARPVAVN